MGLQKRCGTAKQRYENDPDYEGDEFSVNAPRDICYKLPYPGNNKVDYPPEYIEEAKDNVEQCIHIRFYLLVIGKISLRRLQS